MATITFEPGRAIGPCKLHSTLNEVLETIGPLSWPGSLSIVLPSEADDDVIVVEAVIYFGVDGAVASSSSSSAQRQPAPPPATYVPMRLCFERATQLLSSLCVPVRESDTIKLPGQAVPGAQLTIDALRKTVAQAQVGSHAPLQADDLWGFAAARDTPDSADAAGMHALRARVEAAESGAPRPGGDTGDPDELLVYRVAINQASAHALLTRGQLDPTGEECPWAAPVFKLFVHQEGAAGTNVARGGHGTVGSAACARLVSVLVAGEGCVVCEVPPAAGARPLEVVAGCLRSIASATAGDPAASDAITDYGSAGLLGIVRELNRRSLEGHAIALGARVASAGAVLGPPERVHEAPDGFRWQYPSRGLEVRLSPEMVISAVVAHANSVRSDDFGAWEPAQSILALPPSAVRNWGGDAATTVAADGGSPGGVASASASAERGDDAVIGNQAAASPQKKGKKNKGGKRQRLKPMEIAAGGGVSAGDEAAGEPPDAAAVSADADGQSHTAGDDAIARRFVSFSSVTLGDSSSASTNDAALCRRLERCSVVSFQDSGRYGTCRIHQGRGWVVRHVRGEIHSFGVV